MMAFTYLEVIWDIVIFASWTGNYIVLLAWLRLV